MDRSLPTHDKNTLIKRTYEFWVTDEKTRRYIKELQRITVKPIKGILRKIRYKTIFK